MKKIGEYPSTPLQPNPNSIPSIYPNPSSISCTMSPFPLLHNFCRSLVPSTTPGIATAAATGTTAAHFIQFQLNIPQNFRRKLLVVAAVSGNNGVSRNYPSVVLDSLRVLQWDQLCDCVASFAGTSLGKQATKVFCILPSLYSVYVFDIICMFLMFTIEYL